jgi:hypothetical protein
VAVRVVKNYGLPFTDIENVPEPVRVLPLFVPLVIHTTSALENLGPPTEMRPNLPRPARWLPPRCSSANGSSPALARASPPELHPFLTAEGSTPPPRFGWFTDSLGFATPYPESGK